MSGWVAGDGSRGFHEIYRYDWFVKSNSIWDFELDWKNFQLDKNWYFFHPKILNLFTDWAFHLESKKYYIFF